jgi:hypothetical protein
MERNNEQKQDRKPYEAPEVVFESALEVRAGTPLRLPDLFGVLTDPAGLNKQK